MANVTLWGASYSDVPAVTLPQTGGGTVTFYENGGGGGGGGLSYMVDVNTQDYQFAYMLMCMKNGDTVGGRVTYTSAFPNTETKILETGLQTIHGIMFARHDIDISIATGSNATNKIVFIFVNTLGTLDAVGVYSNSVARRYGSGQGTLIDSTPINGAVRFSGGDVYYTGRYNKNSSYQMLADNVEYEWLAW